MTKSNLKKNYIYNVLYQILIIIVPLFTSPYLTRVLGAEKLGIYSFTQSYAHYFVLFILLGVENYGNREIARVRDDKEKTKTTFWEIYAFQFALFVIVVAIYVFLISFVVKDNKLIYWMQLLYVVSAGLDINWCCFGLEKFKLAVTRNSIIKIGSAVAIFLFVKKQEDLWIYTMIAAGSLLLSQAILWPFIIKEIGYTKPGKEGIRRHIKPNLILFLPVLSVSLYTIMDKLMLGVMSSKDEVGYYAYAERIIQIPLSFITALGTVMLPRASNLANRGENDTRAQLLNKSMQFSMLMSVGCTFGMIAIANVLIPWYYGAAFSRCSLFTQLLSPVIALTSWNTIIRTQVVIPEQMDREYHYAVLSGAAINLVLNALLIPKYQGNGAVIATIIAQTTVCVVQYVTVRKKVGFKKFFTETLAFSLCGIVMMIGLFVLPTITHSTVVDIVFRIVIGGIVYLVLSMGYLIGIKKDKVLFNTALGLLKRKVQ